MALWLCRLESDGLAAVGRDDDRARQLGIGAWLIPVQIRGDDDNRWESIQRCFALHSGLPLLLEWVIDRPHTVSEEQGLAAQLFQWLASHRALPLEKRPALLIQGTQHLDEAEQTAQRLRRLLASALGRIPLLLCGAGEPAEGFDGSCDWIAPLRTDSPADSVNYEVHLQQAHWRRPPQGRSIPAVRAPTADDHACMSGASPDLYRSWLTLVSRWSELLANGDSQAPVLIDSWSGHQDYWFTESVKPASLPRAGFSAEHRLIQWGVPSADRLALMVHGYYLDGLTAILDHLPSELLPDIDIYVSTPLERLSASAAVLRQKCCPVVRLFGVPNRGRDIAPFLLQLLPEVLATGHRCFIKLHTKASPHLADGEDWSVHLIQSLLKPLLLQGLQKQLQLDSTLGLLAPAGSKVPITLQLQNNGRQLLKLQRRTGIHGVELLGADFIAGSMFAGRVELLSPLVDLGYRLNDFEAEAGQTDGTLAHALERWIGVLAHQQGLRIDELPGDERAMPGFGYRWSKHLGNPDPVVRMGTSQTQPLQGFPLIDSPLFKAHRCEGAFLDQKSTADQLHQHGFAVVDLGRERIQILADRIRGDLGAQFELEAWREAGGQNELCVQDAWRRSDAVRELALLPEIAAMLQTCWGRQPFAFQTLNFPVGGQQHLHSDAVHFHTEPPGFMCGVWVALEDIHPDSGPLEYVPGSHRLPYLQAADLGVRQQLGVTPDQTIFNAYWQKAVAGESFKTERFTPKLGQALILSANLIHGGSAVNNLQRSRWSQLTHYFFEGCRYYTPMLSDWPEGPVAWRNPFDIAQGTQRVVETSEESIELAAVKKLALSHNWMLQRLVSGLLSRDAMEQALLEEATASREGGAAAFSLALMEWALSAGFTSPWLQDHRARALVNLQRLNEACDIWQQLAEPHNPDDVQSAAREMLSLHGAQPEPTKQDLIEPPAVDSAHLDAALLIDRAALVLIGWSSDLSSQACLNVHFSSGDIQILPLGPVRIRRPDVASVMDWNNSCDPDFGFFKLLELPDGELPIQVRIGGRIQELEITDHCEVAYQPLVDQLLDACQWAHTPASWLNFLFLSDLGHAFRVLWSRCFSPAQEAIGSQLMPLLKDQTVFTVLMVCLDDALLARIQLPRLLRYPSIQSGTVRLVVVVSQVSTCDFSGCRLRDLVQDLLADFPFFIVLEKGPDQRLDELIYSVQVCSNNRLFALLPQRVLTSVTDWIAVLLEARSRSGLTSFHRLQPLHQTSTGQPFEDKAAFLELRPDIASEQHRPVAVVATEPLVVLEHSESMKPVNSRQSWQRAIEAMR